MFLRAGVAESGGVVSLAFSRDYGSPDALAHRVAEESADLATLGQELIGSDRPIVTVSGTPWAAGRTSTEADPLPTDGRVGRRGRSVMALLGLASRGVRSMDVRMPRTVHNEGQGDFAGQLTDLARSTGVSGCPGDGSQRWRAVHALDVAVLLDLESAPTRTSWHAVADEGDAVLDIATVIGRRLGLQEALDWKPVQPGWRTFSPDGIARNVVHSVFRGVVFLHRHLGLFPPWARWSHFGPLLRQ